MPYTARKTSAVKGKPWAIVHAKTGKAVGHSRTKSNAMKSAAVRNARHR